MARVTVEDCIEKIPNRFELVMLASQRTRDISAGSALTVDRDNDKNPVVSLREIADETVELDALKESVVKGLQRHVEPDEPEEEEMDRLAQGQADVAAVTGAADENAEVVADALTVHDEEDMGASMGFQDEVVIDD